MLQLAAERVNRMLSGLRFVIGAILATAMLGVSSLGLYATVKLRHQAKAGPIESSRNLVFDDRADWNQFYDPDSARRFRELARAPAASEPAEASAPPAAHGLEHVVRQAAAPSAANDDSEEHAADKSTGEPQPIAPAVESEPRDYDHATETVAPAGSTRIGAVPDDFVPSALPDVTNATQASAPASIDPRSGEPPAAQAATKDAAPAAQPNEARAITAAAVAIESTAPHPTPPSTPVWDEEPLMIAEDEPPLVIEPTGRQPYSYR